MERHDLPDTESLVECPDMFAAFLTQEQYHARLELYRRALERAVAQAERNKHKFAPLAEFEDGDGI